jgi:Glycosyl hydrolase 2 galactose-binding domain-like
VSISPSFEVNGVPSELDLWNGSITPVAQYSNSKGRTTVPMTLDAHEVKVLAIESSAKPPVHVVDPVAPQGGELITDGNRILFRTSESGQRAFKLSNGRTRTVAANVGPGSHQPPTTGNRPSILDRFSPWTLSVETATPTGAATVAVPGHLGESQFQQYRLKDWREFPAVTGESGVGTYTASTVLDEGWRTDEGDGLWLNLGRIDGTADISVNGEFVGTQIDDKRRWDVTDHLHTGTNTIEVKVRTTLRNAVTKYNHSTTVTQPYGLRGPLRLDPYDSVVVYDGRG